MMDLQDRTGSLVPGKDADFAILDGDPFSVYTKILETWVEGERLPHPARHKLAALLRQPRRASAGEALDVGGGRREANVVELPHQIIYGVLQQLVRPFGFRGEFSGEECGKQLCLRDLSLRGAAQLYS